MKQVWDISRPLANDVAPWPGDTDFAFKLVARIATGSAVNIGALTTSVHNGSHADAPFHFADEGPTIDVADIAKYIGAAVVVDLSPKFIGARTQIEVSDLQIEEAEIRVSRRVLLKTNCFPDSMKFPEWIPNLTLEAASWMGEAGVILLGADVPSVDALDAKELAVHHALNRANIAIVESLDLRAVSAGRYQFAALPLKIVGGDAAPVRAILWRD